MDTQNQIGRVLALPENTALISQMAQAAKDRGPCKLAEEVCDHFGFFNAKGERQLSTCVSALRGLERRGKIEMPAAIRPGRGQRKPLRLGDPVPAPRKLPTSVGRMRQLELERVDTPEQRATWNELIIREHPYGDRPLVGTQIRYLIRSEHGYLGALGFSAAALALADRDAWIGWNSDTRTQYLNRVLGLSRLLIRDGLQCKNLASKVLSMACGRIEKDFKERYNFGIYMLESFVDPNQHDGASYRAANWTRIGQTRGRGRQDRYTERKETRKDIYVYVLHPRFRELMDCSIEVQPQGIAEGLEGDGWARQEFQEAVLGDVRRNERLVEMVQGKGRQPNASWLEIAEGNRHRAKAFYRLIDVKDPEAMKLSDMLQGHIRNTHRRMANERVILCPQDSTDLNYAELLACEGLGFIGKSAGQNVTQGLRLHSTLAMTDKGIPLGVLGAECEARKELPEDEKGRNFRTVPIEQKESVRWLNSVERCIDASQFMKEAMIVNIADREGDIFDVLARAAHAPRVHMLVRALHDRRTESSATLFESVRESPLQGELSVEVPRQSARRARKGQPARESSAARDVKVEVRFQSCSIYPPQDGVNAGRNPVSAWILHLKECSPPSGQEPLEWYLITTLPINSIKDAQRIIGWYCLRWRIEEWHRILKSCCEIETHAHRYAHRLKRVIAIDLVVAYRIMVLTLLGRECPELPAEELFSKTEIKVLKSWSKKKGYAYRLSSIGEVYLALARLGGHRPNSTDPPGPMVLKRAYTKLRLLCEGHQLE